MTNHGKNLVAAVSSNCSLVINQTFTETDEREVGAYDIFPGNHIRDFD